MDIRVVKNVLNFIQPKGSVFGCNFDILSNSFLSSINIHLIV
jgi:hypothetical protein